jgi:hypothetical protein
VHDVLALGQVVEVDQAGVQPLVVRVLGGELGLDLVVLDDAALVGVDEEHPAGLQPALADDGGRVDVEHADLGGQHDEAVVGDPVAEGRRPLRSSTAPIWVPSVNATQAGPSHGSISEEWNS